MKSDRFHTEAKRELPGDKDYREPGQKDRDRLLFCSAFRRLAGVTQVVSVQEGHIFHNRLTHSLKVAQIAKALAMKLIQTDGQWLEVAGGIDAEVVETAALAHDLGHPPFGHIAERQLHTCATAKGLEDGFEGNAQSFRIVTKLAIRKAEFKGLNLTRASLNAILKYPWIHGQNGKKSTRKWGAYHTEADDFAFARAGYENHFNKSIEAEIMDWADDIAYSIHDVEDFYRAGLIPLERMVSSLKQKKDGSHEVVSGSEMDRFLKDVFQRWKHENIQAEFQSPESQHKLKDSFVNIISKLTAIQTPYEGAHHQKAYLRNFTSEYVNKFIHAVRLCDPDKNGGKAIWFDPDAVFEIKMLKELTWHYVMRRPALTAQKRGQIHMIDTLFDAFHTAVESSKPGDWDIFPFSYREILKELEDPRERSRVVVDLIASMTEAQAIQMYQRLMGTSQGSILIPIVY